MHAPPKQPDTNNCCFDFLFIIDFEATCDEATSEVKAEWAQQEIIEFPWVLYDLRSNEIVDEKQNYVKPRLVDGVIVCFQFI